LFEKAVYRRLLAFAEENNVLPEEQFGFRHGRSTVHQLVRVLKILRRNKSVSNTSAMALLDVEKAFDNVWHDGLVFKLQRFGFPIFIVKIIQNYLSGRTFQVSLNGISSNIFNIGAGVPQGSVLGPILFNIFTSDIPPLPGGGILSLFADDTSIIYKGRVIGALINKLQRGLVVLSRYFSDWKIRINAAKTQVIIFPHSNSPRLVPSANQKIRLRESVVDWSKEVAYLGITFDCRLIFREQVDKTSIKCNTLLRALYPIIHRNSNMSLVNKLSVYKQIVLPVIEYGLPIWESCAKCHHLKLQRIQNKFLRVITNSPPRARISEIHHLAQITTLEDRRMVLLERFRDSCLRSIHQVIRDLAR
jgi:hypothetical protein